MLALAGVVALFGGCATTDQFGDGGGAASVAGPTDVLHKGELVTVQVTYATGKLEPHNERIKEDGTITPPLVSSVQAADRRVGDLQKELQEKYAKLFNNVTVTVITAERYYYVDGEVVQRGAKLYLADTDLIGAIAAAGGFTEFANRKNIRVYRPNHETIRVNYNDAIKDPSKSIQIFPGDRVVVRRRLF